MVQLERFLNKIVFVFFATMLLSCHKNKKEALVVSYNKDHIKEQVVTHGGVTYVNNVPYSGTLFTLLEKDTLQIEQYVNGKENGIWKEFYPNKIIKSVREYQNGKKTGKYQAWWENGCKKIDFSFKNDEYEGNCTEWNNKGVMTRQMHYQKGYEEGPQKLWYDDGKIKANYVIIKGRRFGLLGSKNCQNEAEKIFK